MQLLQKNHITDVRYLNELYLMKYDRRKIITQTYQFSGREALQINFVGEVLGIVGFVDRQTLPENLLCW